MSDDFNLDIMQNDADLEKLCVDSVELINYARNIVVKHVNIVQIMTYGNINLLAKTKVDDSIMRVLSNEIAGELMEITFGDK